MRIALLSDIHANLRALQACLAHARGHGASGFALLGDLVGYGAEPSQVVEQAMSLSAEGALIVKGNHDEFAVIGEEGPTLGKVGAAWTHAQLDAAQLQFLDQLPMTALQADALLVHATPDEPAAWHYADNAPRVRRSLEAAVAQHEGVRHVFTGHVHEQRLWYHSPRGRWLPFDPVAGAPIPLTSRRRWLITIGSVGQPRDGDPRAMYALWDCEPSRITFFRVPYDHVAAAEAIHRTGLPPFFARRLLEGR